MSQVSIYFAAEAATILQWSRLSDSIGRKPVLLCGLAGTIISIILFGLSRSFLALVLRCVWHRSRNHAVSFDPQSLLEWYAERKHRRDKEYAGRAYGRI
jgi:MFS family permease